MADVHPVVTIAVVTYNAADHLPRTLASLGRQSAEALRRCEVLVVDGASSDGTVELARSSGVVDRIVSEPDGGIYDAMNKAIRLAEGRWVHYLNAGDAFATDHALETVLAALDSADGRNWLICGARNASAHDGRGAVIRNLPHRWYRHLLGLQPHCHQACWFRRDLLQAIGGHDLSYGTAGDFDVITKFGFLGEPAVVDEVLISYQGAGVSDEAPAAVAGKLSRIRRDRTGLPESVELAVTRTVAAANGARIRLGRLRAVVPRKCGEQSSSDAQNAGENDWRQAHD